MTRRLSAAVALALGLAGAVAVPTMLRADQPIGIMCTIGEKEFPILFKKTGGMRDAVQACLDAGGHPSGVVQK